MKLLNIVSFVLASVSVAIAAPAVDPAMEDRYIIKLKSVTDGERFSLDGKKNKK